MDPVGHHTRETGVMPTEPVIEVRDLHKRYAQREVVKGIDLTVAAGEIVGVVGPNGAGKTTTVESIGGLRRPDSGTIRVAGIDPQDRARRRELRLLLGMQLQECQLPKKTTPAEALDLYRACYPSPRGTDEMLDRFGLLPHRSTRFERLSGGQQQRLSIGLALIGNPRIVILDELTTGLDPAARREIWDFLGELRREGVTMLLVTHSMEEASYLCDRVLVVDDGLVRAQGSPEELADAAGQQHTSFVPGMPLDLDALRRLPGVTEVTADGDTIRVVGDGQSPAVVLAELTRLGTMALHLRVTSPTLDEAYLAITAKEPR